MTAQPFVPYRQLNTNDFLVVFPLISLRIHPTNTYVAAGTNIVVETNAQAAGTTYTISSIATGGGGTIITNLVTTNNNAGLTNIIRAISGSNTFIGAGPGISVTTNVVGAIYTVNNLFSNAYVAAGSNVTVLTNGSTFTVSGQPLFASSLVTNVVTTNSSTGVTNLILAVATNTTITAGTNVTLQSVISGNNLNYTINSSNAAVAAGANITVTTNVSSANQILYTVAASVPTVTTNIVSTNTSGGVTNVVLEIVTNAFPQGSGTSNTLARWINTNLLGDSVVHQTHTNLLESYVPLNNDNDTNAFFTNRIYGHQGGSLNYIDIYGGNVNATGPTNGMRIIEDGTGIAQKSLTLGAQGKAWWTIHSDNSGGLIPVTIGNHSSAGTVQAIGSPTYPVQSVHTFNITFDGGDGGAAEGSANINKPNGPAINFNTTPNPVGIFFQPNGATAATMYWDTTRLVFSGLGADSTGTTLGWVEKSGGNNTCEGQAHLTNGIIDVLTACVTNLSRIHLTYASTNGNLAVVGEDLSHRTNGTSFRIKSSDNTDTNFVNWVIFKGI